MIDEARWQAAALLHEEAVALWRAGRLEDAARTCEQALDGLSLSVGEGHPDLANALDTAARIALDQGTPQAALPRAQAAVAILSAIPGDPVVEAVRAGALRTLGMALRILGRAEEAEARLREAVEAGWDADPAELASSLSALGVCLREVGRLDEAEALYRSALALDPGAKAVLLHNLAGLAHARGQPEDAIRLARKGLAAREGANPLVLASDQAGLGVYLAAAGQRVEGEALLRSALRLYSERLPKLHPERAFLLHNLASLVLEGGRPEEAVELGLEALLIKEAALGETHPEVAATLCILCLARRKLGQDARAQLARAVRIAIRLPRGHPVRRAVGRVVARMPVDPACKAG